MKTSLNYLFSVLTFFLLTIPSLNARLHLPAIIGDHMVLKQKSEVPLWGWEDSNTIIQVVTSWNGKTYQTKSDNEGGWKIFVKTPSAGGPHSITINGKNTVQLSDIMIGEVWLSSGQSNMEWTLKRDAKADSTLKYANNPNIRLFKVPRQISETEQKNFAGNASWKISSPESAAEFSAMTYYFASDIQKKLNVPVGVINASWGGVGIETWISREATFSDSELQKPAERWAEWLIEYPKDSIKYEQDKLSWKEDSIKGVKRARPQEPRSVVAISRPHRKYSVLYNGMIAPCIPYAITGILWYQGTSNVNWPDEYEHQLNTLIQSWRKAWGQGDFCALVGQLTVFGYSSPENAALLREAQLNQRKLKNTYVFCSIDLGMLNDVHPPAKLPYGQRFAYLALNKVYKIKDVPFTSPILQSVKKKDNELIICLKNARGLHISGNKLNDIFISYDGKDYQPATATIENNKLVVSCPGISSTISVKYAWDNPVNPNLYNGDGLPVFPFKYKIK